MKQTTVTSTVTVELSQLPAVYATDDRSTVEIHAGSHVIQLQSDTDTLLEWLETALSRVELGRTRLAVA